MTTALLDLLRHHVDAGTVPGAAALLQYADGSVDVAVAGVGTVGGPPLREDAIVRMQSMTKAVTAVAALRLVEAGRLELDAGVEPWLPELADRRVLRTPTAALDDTVAADRAITLRHLLTNTSGYGMAIVESPLQQAMADNGTEAGPEPPSLAADDWLAALAELPLVCHPGDGWRYHHSFAVLGILLERVTGRPLQQHLVEDLFDPLGMRDTGFWVPEDQLHRLPSAYRHDGDRLVETEPAGGGPYAGVPAWDVSHGELVSTLGDYHRFTRVLAGAGQSEGMPVLSSTHLQLMTSDQVPSAVKTPDSFFPGFWDGMGWGFGVGVETAGDRQGRFGWSGGQGTDFFVEPDGTVAILLTQVELGERTWPLLQEFQSLPTSPSGAAT